MLSPDIACAFCGTAITRDDEDAVQFVITNLWDSRTAEPLFSHSSCARKRFPYDHLCLEALRRGNGGFIPDEIERGEHLATHLPWWGCLAPFAVLAAGAYALFTLG